MSLVLFCLFLRPCPPRQLAPPDERVDDGDDLISGVSGSQFSVHFDLATVSSTSYIAPPGGVDVDLSGRGDVSDGESIDLLQQDSDDEADGGGEDDDADGGGEKKLKRAKPKKRGEKNYLRADNQRAITQFARKYGDSEEGGMSYRDVQKFASEKGHKIGLMTLVREVRGESHNRKPGRKAALSQREEDLLVKLLLLFSKDSRCLTKKQILEALTDYFERRYISETKKYDLAKLLYDTEKMKAKGQVNREANCVTPKMFVTRVNAILRDRKIENPGNRPVRVFPRTGGLPRTSEPGNRWFDDFMKRNSAELRLRLATGQKYAEGRVTKEEIQQYVFRTFPSLFSICSLLFDIRTFPSFFSMCSSFNSFIFFRAGVEMEGKGKEMFEF